MIGYNMQTRGAIPHATQTTSH